MLNTVNQYPQRVN